MKGPLTLKMRSSCVLRRSFKGYGPLVSLFRSEKILAISSDSLSQLLVLHGIHMRQNATKASKIRALMQVQSVKADCRQQTLDKIEAHLKNAEENRKKKKKNTKEATEDAEDEDEQDEASDLYFCVLNPVAVSILQNSAMLELRALVLRHYRVLTCALISHLVTYHELTVMID